jgi:DNA ligase-1
MIKPTKVMLAQTYSSNRVRPHDECWIQPKLDGIRVLATRDGLWTRNFNLLPTLPHIEKTLKPFFLRHPFVVLDGEAYTQTLQDDFPRICSLVKKKYPSKQDLIESRQMQYWIFDMYNPTSQSDWSTRFRFLQEVQKDFILSRDVIFTPTFHQIGGDVEEVTKTFLKSGFEGSIIRLNGDYEDIRSYNLLKLKPWMDDYFEVIGWEEGIGKCKGLVGAWICKTPTGEKFRCTAGGFYTEREAMFKTAQLFVGTKIHVKFQHYMPSGVPRHPVQLID